MHINFLLACLVADLMTGVASSNIQKRSFTIERVANPSFTGHNGPRALAKAYRKYSMPLPRDLLDALDFQDFQKRSLLAEKQKEKRDFMGNIGGRVSLAGAMQDGQLQQRGLLEDLLGIGQQGEGNGEKKPGKKAAKKGANRGGGQTGAKAQGGQGQQTGTKGQGAQGQQTGNRGQGAQGQQTGTRGQGAQGQNQTGKAIPPARAAN